MQALRDAEVFKAIGTNCNPGTSPMTSLLLAMNMAATLFGLTTKEFLAGTPRDAAPRARHSRRNRHAGAVDSTPTPANQKNHVSMARHGTRRLLAMTENLVAIIGIESLAAAQGVELRVPLIIRPQQLQALAAIRTVVPLLEEDRYMAPDLEAAADLVTSRTLNGSVAPGLLPTLEGGR